MQKKRQPTEVDCPATLTGGVRSVHWIVASYRTNLAQRRNTRQIMPAWRHADMASCCHAHLKCASNPQRLLPLNVFFSNDRLHVKSLPVFLLLAVTMI